MTPQEAVSKIYQGNLIDCTKEEYPEIREALQKKAGEMIDGGDGLRAMMMLEEVKRLDKLHEAGTGFHLM